MDDHELCTDNMYISFLKDFLYLHILIFIIIIHILTKHFHNLDKYKYIFKTKHKSKNVQKCIHSIDHESYVVFNEAFSCNYLLISEFIIYILLFKIIII